MFGSRLLVAIGIAATATGCRVARVFSCDADAQCQRGADLGICEPSTGFCSFADPSCDSGRVYDDLAGSPYAGTCVVDDPMTDGGTDTPGANCVLDLAGGESHACALQVNG